MFEILAGLPALAYLCFGLFAGMMWYATISLQGVGMRGASKTFGLPAVLPRSRHPRLYQFTVWWLGFITVAAGTGFVLKLLA